MENKQVSEVAVRINNFATGMGMLLRDFVAPLDPTAGTEEMEYIRKVIDAVDNVVLVATMSEDNEEAIKAVKESSDRMMENLIKLHTKEETKH
ncbi:tail length tape measure protein [Escherichia phage haarsle]|uniref:Uncharacterized protein n=1 Tax=Escherichia phage haarsle TaxID=2696402 RepID=A0A6B9WV32_9CAUD|nr:tail length tape measure protein [Escherichia phage haarsle]QHR69637.1 hypothetical protein haarsle_41 [Escherichia phage haarsle]